MRTITAILLAFLLWNTAAECQTVKLDWAKQMRGSSYDVCEAITLDDEGNTYATGYFSTTVDFDPGPGVHNLTSVNAEDIFLAKYDPAGRLVWAKSIGDFRYQAGYAITLDQEKNIYITGIFFGSLDFDPGPGVATLSSAGNEDVFICKFDNNASFLWAKKIGGVSNDFANAIRLDRSGNIYLDGYFDGTSDFDPGTGVYNMTSVGATDIYICKLTSKGDFVWARQIGGTLSEGAYSLALDDQNNIYATGFFWGTVDFDPGPGVFVLSSDALGDGFILKLSSSGSLVKAGKMGGSSRVRCTSLQPDGSGSMYVTGYFDGDADFDIGPGISSLSCTIGEEDIFAAKYDLDFNLQWVKQVGGPSFQRAMGITTDAAGDVYLTGHYNGSADFDPGPGIHELISEGDPDVFVLKLSAAGNFIWVAQASGLFYGSGYTIKVDKTNNVIVAGTFEGSLDFDPGPDIYTLASAGESEIFIEKLKQCPNSAITVSSTITACTSYTLNGRTYDSSGTYVNILPGALGCDSIITNLSLTINRSFTNLLAIICEGQYHYAGGKLQSKAGVYYDTLKTASGCDSVLRTTIIVNPSPKPTLGPDRNICEGQVLVLNPGTFSRYLWQDNSTQPVFTATLPGTYRVTVTNSFNCTASSRLIIKKMVPLPKNFLPNDQSICTDNVLKVAVPGYKTYAWNTGSSSPGIEIRSAGTYYLTVTDFDNCSGSDSVIITGINCIPIGIPNAFTPNKDGKNDLFRPVINAEIRDYHLQVYNRNGQLIFHTKNIEEGWDGRFKGQPLDAGAYVYRVSFRNMLGKLFTFPGNIMLIR